MDCVHFRLPASPMHGDSAQWSSDGQLCILTGPALHIFVPQPPSQGTRQFSRSRIDMALPTNKTLSFREQVYSMNDPDIRMADLLTETFRDAEWSPSECSSMHGCALVVLTSTHSVSVYERGHQGWVVVDSISDKIWKHLDLTLEKVYNDSTCLDQIEIMAITWSPMCQAGGMSRSFVATGSKHGSLLFWEWSPDGFKFASSIRLSKDWISKISWSMWIDQGDGKTFRSLVAVGTSVGDLQILSACVSESSEILITGPFKLLPADRRICQIAKFNNDPIQLKLAIIKNTETYLCDISPTNLFTPNPDFTHESWINSKLPIDSTLVASIFFDTPSSIRLFSTSGIVTTVPLHPSYMDASIPPPPAHIEPSEEEFSRILVRAALINPNDEEDDVTKHDDIRFEKVMRFHGSVKSAFGGWWIVHYGLDSPGELIHRGFGIESFVVMFRVRRHKDVEYETSLLDSLRIMVSRPGCLLESSVISFMWEVLHYIDDEMRTLEPSNPDALQNTLFSRVSALLSGVWNSRPGLPPSTAADVDGLLRELDQHWNRNIALNSLRIINFMYKGLENHLLALNNSQSIILSYTAHLSEIFEIWTQQVLTVAARILPSVSHIDNTTFLALTLLCDQVILNFHASAFAIAKIVYQCLNRMQTLVSFEVEIGMLDEYIQTRLPSILPINLPARELCPACQAIVPLSEPQRAKCINGHSWDRCSMSLIILATPVYLSCQNCRKRVLKVDSPVKSSIDDGSDFLLRILASVRFCGSCGSGLCAR